MATKYKPRAGKLASPTTRGGGINTHLPYDLRLEVARFAKAERVEGYNLLDKKGKARIGLTNSVSEKPKLKTYKAYSHDAKHALYLMHYPDLEGDDPEQDLLDLYANITHHLRLSQIARARQEDKKHNA